MLKASVPTFRSLKAGVPFREKRGCVFRGFSTYKDPTMPVALSGYSALGWWS